ncbi:unnamed protein product, partial [Rotaria socialis]
ETNLAPDVISSSLTSARQYQTPISDLLKKKQQETNQHHQSTDSLADSSSKEEEDPTRAIDESAAMAKSSTPIRATLPSKATEFILNNHRQSPFRPIRDSPGLQHSLHDVSSPTVNQRRCSSTQSFLVHPNQNINQNIHSSMRRHRLRPSIISSPLSLQQQPLPEQQQPPPQQQQQQPTSFNDHVLITEFGAI